MNRAGPNPEQAIIDRPFFRPTPSKPKWRALISLNSKMRMYSARRSRPASSRTGLIIPAEGYHQDFLERNPTYPYIVVNDLPKIEAFETSRPGILSRDAGLGFEGGVRRLFRCVVTAGREDTSWRQARDARPPVSMAN